MIFTTFGLNLNETCLIIWAPPLSPSSTFRVWSTTSSSQRLIWACSAWWDPWTANGWSITTSRAAPTPTSRRITSLCWPSWSWRPCSLPPPSMGCTCPSTGSPVRETCPAPRFVRPPLAGFIAPPPPGWVRVRVNPNPAVQVIDHLFSPPSQGVKYWPDCCCCCDFAHWEI